MIIKAKHGQSIFDVAIINTGDPLKAFEIAFKNNLNVTDDIFNHVLYIDDKIEHNNVIFEIYNIKKYEPATAIMSDIYGIFDSTFDLTFE